MASQSEQPRPAEEAKAPVKQKHKSKESARDTIESILFAFVLAFLFRTFEAEAFVIPTGSMAPTLYGRHKESTCEQCQFPIVVGASHEVGESGYLSPNSRLQAAICPNCGFENEQLHDAPAFNGDRILVDKYPYEFGNPHRWDVFVFKYPAEPQTNYIKRLVGLPGETIRIRNGNLFRVSAQGEQILRKTPEKQKVLQIPVYNNDFASPEIVKQGWPERWASVVEQENGGLAGWSDSKDGWQADHQLRTYQISSQQSQLAWLRYRHYFPMPMDWTAAAQNRPLDPRARLVGDFCGYNATIGEHPADAATAASVDYGPFWDPDLTINFDLKISDLADSPELLIELCEGTSWYRCRINPSAGDAVLEEIDSQLNQRVKELAKGTTSIKGAGSYRLTFANVDDRLCLWVNGSLANFGTGAELSSEGATGNSFPTNRDLTPVGIAAKGVTATVSHLLLERDIYYRVGSPGRDYRYLGNELIRYVDNPEAWGDFYQRHSEELGERTIEVGAEHYLAFGDNSPQSNDSRMWDLGQETVPRKFLVGKAFWIYWPHGIPFLNNGRGYPITYHSTYDEQTGRLQRVGDYPRYTLPFYPQFWRMKRIR